MYLAQDREEEKVAHIAERSYEFSVAIEIYYSFNWTVFKIHRFKKKKIIYNQVQIMYTFKHV